MDSIAVIPYEAPDLQVDLAEDDVEIHPWVVWAVAGLSWFSALAFAAYCRRTGGWPDIRASWSGFRVACNR